MSKNARGFRIRVNGTLMGRQLAPASGNWCYIDATNPTLGAPTIYEVVVILKRGLNTIEIGLNNVELAPFIDKIKLEKAEINGLSLEAELAEFIGSSVSVACTNASASNGSGVNMGTSTANGIRYNNLVSSETKTYQVDIHYVTKAERNLKFAINGEPFTTLAFAITGNWCFEPGAVIGVKTIEMTFAQGANTIEFRPIGTDAPTIDRIVIREPSAPITSAANQQSSFGADLGTQLLRPIANAFVVYPNPVQSGTPITLTLPDILTQEQCLMQVTDIAGRIILAQTFIPQANRQIKLQNKFSKGVYVLSIVQGKFRSSKKIVIQ